MTLATTVMRSYFTRTALGAFHTFMFTRIVATEDIRFLTGEIHNKQQSHVSEVYTTIPLRIKDSYLSCLLEFGVFF